MMLGTSAYPVEEGDDTTSERVKYQELEARYPKEILPTAYLIVRAELDADLVEERKYYRWAQAVVIRGDGRARFSRRMLMPSSELRIKGVRFARRPGESDDD